MIDPALTPEEWAGHIERGPLLGFRTLTSLDDKDKLRVIALANAALPDGDPRKITHEHVGALREWAEDAPDVHGLGPNTLADILESYLPPRQDVVDRDSPAHPITGIG